MSNKHVHIALLKTRSVPSDGYETACLGTELDDGTRLAPEFLPVLLHRFNKAGMTTLADILRYSQIGRSNSAKYGGVIFTSQRSVEAFAASVSALDGDSTQESLKDVPIYSVGPATTRALHAVPKLRGIRIFGDHTGNGADLAAYILEHYNAWYGEAQKNKPLLFLVGQQRRDVIPRSLMDPTLEDKRQIPVIETVVYETTEMPSFANDLHKSLTSELSKCARSRWIIIFSPTGCDTVLRELGLLDESTDGAAHGERDGKTFIATIGPTTRQHLVDAFRFEPDFWSRTPSPEGIIQGIINFEISNGKNV